MTEENQDIFTPTSVNNSRGWDAAIIEAQRQIQAAEKRISRLKLSVKVYKEMRDKGEPFIAERRSQSNVAQK